MADISRHHHLGRLAVDVFAVVGVETAAHHDLAAAACDGVFVTQHRAFYFAAAHGGFHQHLLIKPQGQFDGGVVLGLVANLAHTHRRALVGRFDEHRQAEFIHRSFKGSTRGVAAGQGNERRHGNAGVAQQALADVLVHAHCRAEHVGADERQVSHAKQALQAAVFAEGAVDDGEDHVDVCQQAVAGGFHHLLAGFAGHHRQFAVGLVKGDECRVFLVDQEVRGVVEVPVAGLVDADQDRLKACTVKCIDNIARRLQRDLVLSRTTTKNNPHPHLAHDSPHC